MHQTDEYKAANHINLAASNNVVVNVLLPKFFNVVAGLHF